MKKSTKKAVSGIYDHAKIEKKWQKKWEAGKLYVAKDNSKQKKFYGLIEFPYPSGQGLHVGHIRSNTAMDIISRKRRREGFNVLYPIGWDAFGLPTENYAIKTGIHPTVVTKKNTDIFRRQLKELGFSFDWSREIDTTDPKYYKWTQWIFLQFLKQGLAYKKKMTINWCPKDLIGLANEEVINGRCERCGTPVEKREKEQWMLAITKYADRLLSDLDAIDTSGMQHFVDVKNPPIKGKKTVQRRTVNVLVRDPKTGKYIGLKWKKFPWTTFIIGGVEKDEDIIAAAKREVIEETGYTDLKFVKVLGKPILVEYCAAHKDENRQAVTTGIIFELNSDARKEMNAYEKNLHEVIWLEEKDLNMQNMNCAELPYLLKALHDDTIEYNSAGVPCFVQNREPGKVRPELPFVERNAIAAIVKHWKEDKYIGLKWKKVDWQTIITGGIETSQTAEEAAKIEITEETGYVNAKFVKNLGKVEAKFFHVPKNENRFAHFDVLYFELQDGKRNQISDKEKEIHDVKWLTREQMTKFITPQSQKYMWSNLFLGNKPEDPLKVKPLLDWPESIKELQRNWIGKSEGALIRFKIQDLRFKNGAKGKVEDIEVFTTRPDTLFGVTYVVLAPEHKLLKELMGSVENKSEVEEYIAKVQKETEIERTDVSKEKTGVELKGVRAVNPANNEEVPVWIADYVLADYGTGAVMAVPAHDTRDWDFAKKYNLPIKQVIAPFFTEMEGPDAPRADKKTETRRNVLGIVKHWSENKFIALNWKPMGWHSLVVGGAEKGEDDVVAMTREIEEETGYKNLKFVRKVAPELHTYHYTPHKDQNRYGVCQALYFELKDGEQVPVDDGEKNKHDVVWMDYGSMQSYLNLKNNSFIWDRFLNGEKSYDEAGIVINSGQFNMRNSHEILKEVTKFVGGQWVVKYKLRDWVFSRQRYWGEPIPVVHCTSCAARQFNINAVILHGCPSDKEKAMDARTRTYDKHWIPWTKKQLEKQGIKTYTPLMPEPWHASYDSWKIEFEKLPINENSILIGHSCGTAFLTRWLGETKRKVRALILVAPWKIASNKWKEDFYDFEIDQTIKKRVPNIYLFTSNNEENDGKVSAEIYSKVLNPKVISLQNRGHFVFGHMKTEEFPELIDIIQSFTSIPMPVPDKNLPVTLPKVKNYQPTKTGESPLAAMTSWVKTKCPKCKGPAKRETDTMPNWAGSSWYYLRYTDPKNSKKFADAKKLDYWTPVDWYNGGMEHTTLHLLYSRFWHKFLFDLGYVPTAEPYKKRTSHGLILAEGGVKMSKSKGNVINPDDLVKTVGADSLRAYEMFMGPFDQHISWNSNNIAGVRRFIERVWKLREKVSNNSQPDETSARIIHKAIKKVSDDIETMRFNTAISTLMIAVNELEKKEAVSKQHYETLIQLLAPFAPHVTEELWASLGNKKSIHVSEWPKYDESLAADSEVKIIVQVNGKVRGTFSVSAGADKPSLENTAKNVPEIKKWIDGKKIKKVIVVPDRLVNFVVS